MRKNAPFFVRFFTDGGLFLPKARVASTASRRVSREKRRRASPEPGPGGETRARSRGCARGGDRVHARDGTPPRHATRRVTEALRRARGRALIPPGYFFGYFQPPDGRLSRKADCLPVDPDRSADRSKRPRLTEAPPLPLCFSFHSAGNPRKDGETTIIKPSCPPHDANKPRPTSCIISRALPTLRCRETPDLTGCTPYILYPGSRARREKTSKPLSLFARVSRP